MKRALLTGFALLGASLLSGCPIYPEDRLVCDTNLDCPGGYACGSNGYCYLPGGGGGPSGPSCNEPKDCDFNETCTAKGVCRSGDCSFHGCVSGYTCAVDQGVWSCVQSSGSGGTGGGDAGTDTGSDAPSEGSTGGAGGTGGSDASSGGSDAATDGAAGSDAASDASDAAVD